MAKTCMQGNGHPKRAMKAHKGSRGIALLYTLTSVLHGGGWSMPQPGCLIPGKETENPLYRRLGGPQGQSERVKKNLAPTIILSLDHQPVANAILTMQLD
jgi:hypothetical protein